MDERKLNPLLWTLLFSMVWSGCTTPRSGSDNSVIKPVKPKQTIDQCITVHAVVTYYLPGKRTYLTDQRHIFCPNLKSLQIRSAEPAGTFVWSWTEGHYSRTGPKDRTGEAWWDRPQVLAVYAGFLYGGGFLAANNLPAEEMITLEGQRYEPMVFAIPDKSIQIHLYRNQDSKLIDRVIIHDTAKQQKWMAVCYNWSYYTPKNLLIPRKLDIYDITDGIFSKNLLLQVDYKKVLIFD